MNKILIAAAVTLMTSTLAFAQTSTGGGATNNSAGSNNNSKDNATKSNNVRDCSGMMGKAHSGSGMEFSDNEAKPYLDKMSSMNMAPKTKGKMTTDDFMTACNTGAFDAM